MVSFFFFIIIIIDKTWFRLISMFLVNMMNDLELVSMFLVSIMDNLEILYQRKY